jgi:hypothetical protein
MVTLMEPGSNWAAWGGVAQFRRVNAGWYRREAQPHEIGRKIALPPNHDNC